MVDIIPVDLGGIVSGASGVVGQVPLGILTLAGMMYIPIGIAWVLMTAVMISTFFMRRMTFVMPNQWAYNVSTVRPYAEGKMAIYNGKGALINEDAIKRLKVQTKGWEDVVMQKPDPKDIYLNREIIILAIGAEKRLCAQRYIDYKNHLLWIGVENPQVAQLYFIDKVALNDPDWFFQRFHSISLMGLGYLYVTFFFMISNFVIVYPFIVRFLFWGS